MRVIRNTLFIGSLLLVLASITYGGDIYIAQNTTGSDTGANCANAHSASWFNSNATGGNTYHLCGTFTGTSGSTMLTPPSGSAGNIVKVLFETGAVLTAPYWGGAGAGAITLSKKSYVTIDGGTNGVIKNTANGTSEANHHVSQGIFITGSNHIEVKNLTIQDIYKNQGSSSGATDTAGVSCCNIQIAGTCSYITIERNHLSAARAGVMYDFSGNNASYIDINNNVISDCAWSIMVGAGNGGESTSNIIIHDNELTNWTNWQYPSSTYHTDGIILFQPTANGNTFVPKIYNNYIHGDLGNGSPTAFIYCTNDGNSGAGGASCQIYNNLLINTNTTYYWIVSTGRYTSGHKIYNNTLIGSGASYGVGFVLTGTNTSLENNITMNVQRGLGSYVDVNGLISSCDYNVWYNTNSTPFYGNDGSNFYTFAQWQGLGFDTHGYNTNPSLDGSYIPQVGGSAIDHGTSESAYFTTDKLGTTRPQGAAWDIGAYEYAQSITPPKGLTTVPTN